MALVVQVGSAEDSRFVGIYVPPLTGDATRLGQLQEWANHYHITLTWKDAEVKVGDSRSWTSYPIIQGHEYKDFTGAGPKQRHARGKAAEMIHASPGTLDMAKAKKPIVIAHM